MRFEQVRVSPTLEKTFGENFRNRWNLGKYKDLNEPAIFFGLYTEDDLSALEQHNGKSLVIWGGADMRDAHLIRVKKLIETRDCFTVAYPGVFSDVLTKYGIQHREFYIAVKDYSQFKPVPLGDKIYVYKGVNGNRAQYFQWNEIIVPIIKYFGEDKVIYTNSVSLTTLTNDYYSNSFMYVKPSPKGGCTAMFELGCMGRRTIGQGYSGLRNFVQYTTISDLIKSIKIESRKIGSLQSDVSAATHNLLSEERWLNLDIWKK